MNPKDRVAASPAGSARKGVCDCAHYSLACFCSSPSPCASAGSTGTYHQHSATRTCASRSCRSSISTVRSTFRPSCLPARRYRCARRRNSSSGCRPRRLASLHIRSKSKVRHGKWAQPSLQKPSRTGREALCTARSAIVATTTTGRYAVPTIQHVRFSEHVKKLQRNPYNRYLEELVREVQQEC